MTMMLSRAPLRPMAEAPLVPILAVHFERGPIEVRPDHEANYWLPERVWIEIDNEECGHIPDGDLEGWIAESAE